MHSVSLAQSSKECMSWWFLTYLPLLLAVEDSNFLINTGLSSTTERAALEEVLKDFCGRGLAFSLFMASLVTSNLGTSKLTVAPQDTFTLASELLPISLPPRISVGEVKISLDSSKDGAFRKFERDTDAWLFDPWSKLNWRRSPLTVGRPFRSWWATYQGT